MIKDILRPTLAALALTGLATTAAEAQNTAPAPADPAAGTTAAAAATAPKAVGSYKSWAAYTFEDGGRLMCYSQSAPTGSLGEADGRGPAAAMVIQAPDAAAKDQVSIVLGFAPKSDKSIALTIGSRPGRGKKFTLKKFAVGRAWAETGNQDKQIVAALKRYNYLVVDAVSEKGEKVRDTYNLSGFSDAYDAAVKACR